MRRWLIRLCNSFNPFNSIADFQAGFELPAGGGHVGRVENGGDHADATGAGGEHLIKIPQVDAANSEPGDYDILCGPADILKGDGLCGGFRAGGIHGADGNVIWTGGDCSLRLVRRVRAQADTERIRTSDFGNLMMADVEKIFLSQMTKVRADFLGDFEVVVDH